MNTHPKSEKGQALILIALALVVLIAFTALAVDGGNIYAERRRAQNAADTTVLDAALAKVRGGNLYAEGLARAASNNYSDSDSTSNSSSTTVNVEIYNPPISGPYAGASEYIQVFITSQVDTFFAGIVGVSSVTNKVESIARAVPSVVQPMYNGNAVVGVAPHECRAVTFQGNASTVLINSGIFIQSDCATDAFFNNSNAGDLTLPCLQAVGGIPPINTGVIHVPSNCINQGVAPLPAVVEPNPTCNTTATISGNTMSPGNYTSNSAFPPAGVTNLNPGVYCITQADFRMNGSDTLTGIGVTIRVDLGSVRIAGGNTILSAPTSGSLKGLLIFLPSTNSSPVIINGNGVVQLTGTIMAQSSNVQVNGTSSTTNISGQIIGYTIVLTGTGGLSLTYNPDENYHAPIPPSIELTR